MIGFTRNPSVLRVLKIVDTLQTPEKHEGFEFFRQISLPPSLDQGLVRQMEDTPFSFEEQGS
jgi:hypothetical protein